MSSTPDFSFLDQLSCAMITRGYKICCVLNSWNTLASFTDYSHLFSENEIKGSGVSIAWTMSQLDYISKNGYEKFKEGCEKGYIHNFYSK